jgi:hypothetical protein
MVIHCEGVDDVADISRKIDGGCFGIPRSVVELKEGPGCRRSIEELENMVDRGEYKVAPRRLLPRAEDSSLPSIGCENRSMQAAMLSLCMT